MSAIYVKTPADIPSREHWAILEGRSISIPGDERSRTNPGHGYPESVERFLDYVAYLDEAEFKRELIKQLECFTSGAVRGIHVSGTYSKLVTVAVKESS